MLLQVPPVVAAEVARDAHQHAQAAAAAGGPLGALLYFAVLALLVLCGGAAVLLGYKFIWKAPGATQQEVSELRKEVAATNERMMLFKLNTDKDFAGVAAVTDRLLNTANSIVALTERSAGQARDLDATRAEVERIKDVITNIRVDVGRLAERHKLTPRDV